MKKAVRPVAFSAALVLAATLVPAGATFAQGGMWRPDPAVGAMPGVDPVAFRPSAAVFQPRGLQAQSHSGFAAAAPRYRIAERQRSFGSVAPTPAWRSPNPATWSSERRVPAPAPWYHWAAAPMPAPLPWSAPVHAGYAAYGMPPMPAWGGMQPQPAHWPPALAYQGHPYGQPPAMYPPAPAQAPGQWHAPAPGLMDPRPVSGGWRPDPLAASTAGGHYRPQASAYTSPRHPVFRGAPATGWQHAQARPMIRPQAAPAHWRPDTTVAWSSRQAFRPLAYGRSIARSEQPVRAVADRAPHSQGDLPGWATTLDRFDGTEICAWCSSGT